MTTAYELKFWGVDLKGLVQKVRSTSQEPACADAAHKPDAAPEHLYG
jgi:hypothetical protein